MAVVDVHIFKSFPYGMLAGREIFLRRLPTYAVQAAAAHLTGAYGGAMHLWWVDELSASWYKALLDSAPRK